MVDNREKEKKKKTSELVPSPSCLCDPSSC